MTSRPNGVVRESRNQTTRVLWFQRCEDYFQHAVAGALIAMVAIVVKLADPRRLSSGE